jgi:predicted metalloprotease
VPILRRRLAALLAALCAACLLAGCGGDDGQDVADQVRQEVRERSDRLREQLREQRDRLRKRIEDALGELEKAFPRARTTSPQVQSRGNTESNTIDRYMTKVLQDIDRYWTKTFAASDLPEPRVRYSWIPPGGRQPTGCGTVADDNAAFYCPADDTIYVARKFAAALWEGVAQGLPGQQAGFGRAAGDFGVAYVIAHEYAHNLQEELGLFRIGRANSSKPFELQADCLAGAWGAAVYAEGRLSDEDVQEAINTALAVGDFDVSSRNHHGTPQERRDAWLTGFRSADPAACRQFVPA